MNPKIRVLIVDDSAFFRHRISDMLVRNPEIEVVGTANNGYEGLQQARSLKPDVITMDVEMPVMDGITAVKRIMAEVPTPIIMFSSLTHEGAKATLDALDAGAVDFLPKQLATGTQEQETMERMLARRALLLGRRQQARRATPAAVPSAIPKPTPAVTEPIKKGHYKLVAIGASTGGPVAIQTLLASLPKGFPLPLVLVVHMPASFTPAYAQRLDGLCNIGVQEAVDGDRLQPGRAYLAPGGKQMLLERQGGGMVVRISDSLPGQTYRPSVDVTLGSAARAFTDSVLAIVLTGMGSDGMQGSRLLKEAGSTVWSQDEASCVVYGMPQAVEKAGLSDRVLPLDEIGPVLTKVV
jgi:two-component system chemotaxis response regulator CheB